MVLLVVLLLATIRTIEVQREEIKSQDKEITWLYSELRSAEDRQTNIFNQLREQELTSKLISFNGTLYSCNKLGNQGD